MNALRTAFATYRKTWVLYALAVIAAYPLIWIAAMVLRFGTWPNYLHIENVLAAYRQIWNGTPSALDALRIALDEPWIEVGHMSAQWGISEWSFMLLPPKLLIVAVLAALFALVLVLRAQVKPHAGADAAAIAGVSLAGLAAASLFWVVCCATPTWVVALAMLGVDNAVVLAVQPLGPLISLSGFALLGCSLFYYLRGLAGRATEPILLTAV